MKKLLTISALLGSLIIFAPSATEAKTGAASVAEPQIRVQIGRQRNNRWRNNRRSTIQTRVVRRGFATYRETYRVTYLPNGAVRTRLISRERIGGRRW
jgi:hypothetical protein